MRDYLGEWLSMQASASAVRAVLAAVYARLGQASPRSFALCEGPIVLPLLSFDWGRFEQVARRRKLASYSQ